MGDIYVIAEQFRGALSDITFELLGKAKELAAGGQVVAVLVGGAGTRDLASQLGAAGRVLVIEDERLSAYTPEAYKAVLVEAVGQRDPGLVLVGNTSMGMDMAAGLSAATGLPLVAYCLGLATEGSAIVATSRLYGGKMDVEVALDGSAIVSVQAGAFPADPGRASGSPEIEEVKAPAALETVKTKFLRLIEPEAGDVDITRADVLVSVGRGIQNADNIEVMQELADAMGAPLAASRPITDAGWLPKTRQVGKSGLTVKPKLYLCAGISGAPEHLEGMRDADLIIAINTDERAPIFDVANFGVTEDLFDVVPALTEKLRS